MFAEFDLEELMRVPFGLPLMWVYVLIANVVLVNMLIAMFAETYTRIKKNAEIEYRYQHYLHIFECGHGPAHTRTRAHMLHVHVLCARHGYAHTCTCTVAQVPARRPPPASALQRALAPVGRVRRVLLEHRGAPPSYHPLPSPPSYHPLQVRRVLLEHRGARSARADGL